MKKRILSLLMAISILTVAFAGFCIPANATDDVIYVDQRYYETVIEITEDMTSPMVLSFTVPFTGYYIIQTFGCPIATSLNDFEDNGAISQMRVLQGNTSIAWTHGSPWTGYGHGRFVNCELSAGVTYTLRLTFTAAVQTLRLSFTYAEGQFNELPPISSYDDIFTDGPEIFSFTFAESNGDYAQVARVLCTTDEEDLYAISLLGGGFEKAYVLDPTSALSYEGVEIWESGTAQMYLEAGVPYYIVVYIGEGDEPANLVDTIEVTMVFERIG